MAESRLCHEALQVNPRSQSLVFFSHPRRRYSRALGHNHLRSMNRTLFALSYSFLFTFGSPPHQQQTARPIRHPETPIWLSCACGARGESVVYTSSSNHPTAFERRRPKILRCDFHSLCFTSNLESSFQRNRIYQTHVHQREMRDMKQM